MTTVAEAFEQGMKTVNPQSGEKKVELAVAAYLTTQPLAKLWSKATGGQFQGRYRHDLAWSLDNAETPEIVVQVKTGGLHQEDQELLEFLADCLACAFEKTTHASTFYSVAVVWHNGRTGHYWSRVAGMARSVTLEVTPSAATSALRVKPESWLIAGPPPRIQPFTRTQLDQVFTGTQRAKLSGIYHRGGTATVNMTTEHLALPGADVLIWCVGPLQLQGAALPAEQWLP